MNDQNANTLAGAAAADAATLSAEDAALIAQGAALDAGAEPPPVDAKGQPVAPTDYGSEAAMLLKALVGIAAPFFPSVPKIWTDDKQAAVAAAAAPVMEKYGFTLGSFMGDYGAELTLLIVAGPVVLETIDGIKADRAEAKRIDKVDAAVAKGIGAVAGAVNQGEFAGVEEFENR